MKGSEKEEIIKEIRQNGEMMIKKERERELLKKTKNPEFPSTTSFVLQKLEFDAELKTVKKYP